MKNVLHKSLLVVSTALLTVLPGITAAEDIEIYQRDVVDIVDDPDATRPNILFMLDTSGSMRRGISVPYAASGALGYDKKVDYGSSDNDTVYIYDQNLTYLEKSFSGAQNVCKKYKDNLKGDAGLYYDRLIQWTSTSGNLGYWSAEVTEFSDNGAIVECQKDRNKHGATNGDKNDVPRRANGDGVEQCTKDFPCNRANDKRYREKNNFSAFDSRSEPVLILASGNLHDFIQTNSADTTGLGLQTHAGKDYCNAAETNNNADNYLTIARFTTPFFDSELSNRVSICEPKIITLRNAMRTLLDTENVNFGVGRFNNNNNGGTIFAGVKKRTKAEIEQLKNRVDTLPATGSTPMGESLYEGYLYFAGEKKRWGRNSGGTQTTDPNILNGSNYISPTTNQCASDAMVLLSDGKSNNDGDMNNQVKDLYKEVTGLTNRQNCSVYDEVDGDNQNCMPELAEYMAKIDLSEGVDGDNLLRTYTVSFGRDLPVLQDTAARGTPTGFTTPGYYAATDTVNLQAAFQTIVTDVVNVSTDTFVSPAVSVSTFNRLQFRDELYYALFSPGTTPRWEGNIKKYKINSEGQIVGQDPNLDVISPTTGYFIEEAKSFWSDVIDGPEVAAGGFSGELTANRNIYANTSGDIVEKLTVENFVESTILAPNLGQVDLLGRGVDNAAAAAAELTANRKLIAQWTLGQDVDLARGGEITDPNKFVADSLHSTPFVLSYGDTINDPEDIVFSVTNRGVLNAINGEDGSEAWAYIPSQSLLPNLGAYYNDSGSDHVYGLDGALSFLVERFSANPVGDGSATPISKAILFAGQRRGGNKLFAIDVTNASGKNAAQKPVEKLWTVDPDSDNDFSEMGQTWSKPRVAKVRYCDSVDQNCANDDLTDDLRDVIFIGGGYNLAYDTVGDNGVSVDSLAANAGDKYKGNAIYMIDALTGELLWKASKSATGDRDLKLSDMNHSIVSSPLAIDVSGDGATDILFAVDISGKVWRIDFNAGPGDDGNDVSSSNNSDDVDGGMIAQLSDDIENRLFYNNLTGTILNEVGGTDGLVINLVIGSGYQAHPLAQEGDDNRIYSFYDRFISEPNIDQSTQKADYSYDGVNVIENLSELTQTVNGSGVVTTNLDTSLNGGVHEFGFYLPVVNSQYEKILQTALVADGIAFFVSYLPDNKDTSTQDQIACRAGVGSSRLYELDLKTGASRSSTLAKGGISGQPTVIFVPTSDGAGDVFNRPVVLVGTEILNDPGTGLNGPDEDDSQGGGDVGGGSCKPTASNYYCCAPGDRECICNKSDGLKNICAFGAIKTTWWEENRAN